MNCIKKFPQNLCINNTPESVDAIVVLGGDISGRRTDKASAIYKKYCNSYFIVSGGPTFSKITWAEFMKKRAIKNGILEDKIVSQEWSKDTKEDAKFTTEILSKFNFKKIILVTSKFHSKRAVFLFRHHNPSLHIISCPSDDNIDENWWKNSQYVKVVFKECLKTIYDYFAIYFEQFLQKL